MSTRAAVRALHGQTPDTTPVTGADLVAGDVVYLHGRVSAVTLVVASAKHTYIEFDDATPGEWEPDHVFRVVAA